MKEFTRYGLFSLIFAILFIQTVFASPILAAEPVRPTQNTQVQHTTNNNCQIKFGWVKFNNQRKLSYGAWDGTYTVFVFRKGQTRDQFVAREQTSDTKIVIENLIAGEDYEAEVFITGAFLAGRTPYWWKYDLLSCSTAQVRTVTTTARANPPALTVTNSEPLANAEPRVLPETGWELGLIVLVSSVLLFLGGLFYLKPKTFILQKKLDRKLFSS